MKLKTLLCVMLFLSACSPTVTALPTAVGSVPAPTSAGLVLPDLVVSSMYVAQVDENGRCMNGYQIHVTISNQGQAAADNVNAVEMTGGQMITVGRLEAGQSMTYYLPVSATSGNYIVVVDPQNLVSESNETNNNLSYLAPTPTPVLECLASPTPVATIAPPLIVTPLPNGTNFPNSLNGLTYVDTYAGQLWQIKNGEPVKFMDGIATSFSNDGSLAVYERDGDIWLSDLISGSNVNVTHSSDRADLRPQVWRSTLGQKIVFSSAADGEADRLYMSNLDGAGLEAISSAHSLSWPGLDPTGQSIAFDENGSPMIYTIGAGAAPFLPELYNYQADVGSVFTSPSISPNGALISWWVCTTNAAIRKCDLVVFTRAGEGTYQIVHSYSANENLMEGWLPAPVWSPDGQWLAVQTSMETTLFDIWIMHPDGSEAYRIGLGLNPVWNPDSQHLAFRQRYPPTESKPSSINVIEVRSFHTESTLIVFGSIPVFWQGQSTSADTGQSPRYPIPSFSVPVHWGMFSNPNPPFTFRYPPDALVDNKVEQLTINLPFNPGTQMIEKSIRMERRIAPPEGCYTISTWDGTLQITGVEYHYVEGHFWEHSAGGYSYFQSLYTATRSGFCISVWLRIGMHDGSDATFTTPLPPPSASDTDPEVLFDILSTLQFQ